MGKRIPKLSVKDFNSAKTSSRLSRFSNKVFLNRMKINNFSKSDSSPKTPKNICKLHQSSAQCAVNTNHQPGNVYFVKKSHVKTVFLSETIVKETIGEAQSFCTSTMLNINLSTKIEKFRKIVFTEMSIRKDGLEIKSQMDGNAALRKFTTSLIQSCTH